MNLPSMNYANFQDEDGKISETWLNTLNQIFTQLQNNLSNEGYLIPGQTTEDIQRLVSPKSANALLVDSTLQEPIMNLNGVWVKLVTAPYP